MCLCCSEAGVEAWRPLHRPGAGSRHQRQTQVLPSDARLLCLVSDLIILSPDLPSDVHMSIMYFFFFTMHIIYIQKTFSVCFYSEYKTNDADHDR